MPPFDGPSWTHELAEGPTHLILTGGQTRPSHPLEVATLLTAPQVPPPGPLVPEAEQALALCRGQPSSVAEISALLNLPVQITKVLLSRLMDRQALFLTTPATHSPDDHIALLEAIRDGLQRL
ncbi:DUF742 domain-containing protein [Streptomyces mirabilis]|uniref:DUF742 domain-containing protein n=1 Tax=Streptomyces mirabilis TaxID=68239 RepID=UPI00382FD8F7